MNRAYSDERRTGPRRDSTMRLMILIALTLVSEASHAVANRAVHFSTVTRSGCRNEFSIAKDGDDFFVHGDGCFRAPEFKLLRESRRHSSHNYIFNGRRPHEITVINSQGDRKIINMAQHPQEYRKAVGYTLKLSTLVVQQASRQRTDRTAEPNARAIAGEIKKRLAKAQLLHRQRRG